MQKQVYLHTALPHVVRFLWTHFSSSTSITLVVWGFFANRKYSIDFQVLPLQTSLSISQRATSLQMSYLTDQNHINIGERHIIFNRHRLPQYIVLFLTIIVSSLLSATLNCLVSFKFNVDMFRLTALWKTALFFHCKLFKLHELRPQTTLFQTQTAGFNN